MELEPLEEGRLCFLGGALGETRQNAILEDI